MQASLQRILSQIPITSSLHRIIEDTNILSALRNAKTELKRLRQKDGTLRQTFIEQQIKQYYINNDSESARKLQIIRNN